MVKSKSVFIVTNEVGSFSQSINSVFRTLGWQTKLFFYREIRRRSLIEKGYDCCFHRGKQQSQTEIFSNEIRKHVIPAIEHEKPSLLLFLKGDWLEQETAWTLQKLALPMVNWTYDSLSRCPTQNDITRLSQYTFYMDRGDIPKNAANASWLPLGYDEKIYFPIVQPPKIDILFVGALRKMYSKRRFFLKKLASSNLINNYRCAFVGTTGKRINNLFLFLPRKMEWIAEWLPAAELSYTIANSKVCINIHQDDGTEPINPYFFAIPGTATCQIAENKDYFNRWLIPEQDFFSFNDDNFIETIEKLLQNDKLRNEIARTGYEKVLSMHTFFHRIKHILSVISL